MEGIFLVIVFAMFLLAITDLVVGVSNDAVNFLNSAIGAKAASFKRIMIIASVGIIFGSVCSSGMMEVARRGVFNPQFFTIEEIMYLFSAVMLTDIILLDFYNSIALPTSTTVSIVFELLGSAVAISFFSVLNRNEPISYWGHYMNGNKAIIIIVGIFLSVAIAFVVGWLVQYLTRLIVSFELKKTMRGFGSFFGAASVALIVVFIVLKGLKGIPFISKEILDQIKSNVTYIAIGTFAISFLLFQIFISKKDFNVYRFVTLLGTFALAMAFASNDLVNFIGVPIASFDSYMAWKKSGVEAENFLMESLAKPVQTNPLFLLGAGIVMTITLWFSKKARSVVKTSVNLGRQDEGAERFEANEISRGIVIGVSALSNVVNKALPEIVIDKINKRFVNNTSSLYENKQDKPAFDLVRSSVNLIVAAAIILGATLLHLPLSTTFVSFMVLMGTSLADKAWAQGSAVYRVAGVLTVVGGWFLTAIIALTVSMVFASLLINFKVYAFGLLILAAILLLFKSHIFYKTTRYRTEVNLELADKWFKSDFFDIEYEVRTKLAYILEHFEETYQHVIDALTDSNRHDLHSISLAVKEVESTNELYKVKLTQQIKEIPEEYQEGGKVLMLVYDLEDNLLYALGNIIRFSLRYVSNLHPKLLDEQVEVLADSKTAIKEYIHHMLTCLKTDKITEKEYGNFKTQRKQIVSLIDSGISQQIKWATSKKLSGKNSELILTILLSNKNIITHSSKLIKLFYKVKSDNMKEMLDQLIEE